MKALVLIISFLPIFSIAQLNSFSANELDSLQYLEKRPVVFFINTD